MKVVVTGAAGMLAQEVVPGLRSLGHSVVPLTDLDVTQVEDVRKAIAGARPDWVFHLAAFTDVDGCESRAEHAMQVNGAGAGHVAAAAAEAGAGILSMSSDYVFPGDDPKPRREDDPTGPISAYGRSKLAGEEAVRAANPRHLIVRTAWLYGKGGRNFVDTIRTRALAGEPIAVVADQRGAPTWTHDLAGAMAELFAKDVTGTFHITNSGSCTWHDFAVEICRLAGAEVEVKRISSADLARAAKRPAYSVLDMSRFEQVLGFQMASWRDALARYFEQPASVTQGSA